MTRAIHCFLIAAILLSSAVLAADVPSTAITVGVDKPGAAISPTLNGVFFEDINFGADGGLYAERVKNSSFEFSPDNLMGWRKLERDTGNGQLAIRTDGALNDNNPHYLRLTIDNTALDTAAAPTNSPAPAFGVVNEGFRGMGIARGAKYTFSTYARSADASPPTLTVELQDHNNHKLGSVDLPGISKEWKSISAVIEAGSTDDHAHLVIASTMRGSVDLDMVSLFPQDTWQNRPRGLRPDLVQLLKDMHPKFMRFPGGCIVEGHVLENRYQWKNTIGDLAQRRLILNRWNNEFPARGAPDYFQSYGLGFFEFFQLCEDIGASPLPILNCGMACQYNSAELAPLDGLDPYIQDALDLVEFANGPADSTWGKKRAEMGHPAPFALKMMGVGNEQWGPQYIERYQRVAGALKAKYPSIELIAAAGPSPSGRFFDYAWNKMLALHADILDEHYYMRPDWFFANSHRYDHYDRKGPKVFAGEFAAQSVATASALNRNDWECALAEAAFMTGLERNADVVQMASYAPLFAHVDAWQWTPNLIWFDNLRSYGTPSYYVQQLFSANSGSVLLPVDVESPSDNLFTVASRDEKSGDVIVKLVNHQSLPRMVKVKLSGMTGGTATAQTLASDDLKMENSLDQPKKLAPVTTDLGKVGGEIEHQVPGYSLTVLRVHSGG